MEPRPLGVVAGAFVPGLRCGRTYTLAEWPRGGQATLDVLCAVGIDPGKCTFASRMSLLPKYPCLFPHNRPHVSARRKLKLK